MALELKGLKANMLKLQARVDKLNSLAMAGDETGARLEGHLSDIGKQLGAHVDDIEFAANVLGNSNGRSSASGEALEPPKPPPAVQEPAEPKNESTAAPATLATDPVYPAPDNAQEAPADSQAGTFHG
jgi:hypothetical protein